MYSDNGTDWTIVSTPSEQSDWKALTYGNGNFVAVARSAGTPSSRRVIYSPNGVNWTLAEAAENNRWFDVTYGDGKFLAVSIDGGNRIMYANEDDLDTWYSESAPEANAWYGVAYGNGTFVSTAMSSTSGLQQVMLSSGNLTFANGTDMSLLEDNDIITQGSASGKVSSITNTTVTLSSSTGKWITEANGGSNVLGPDKDIIRSLTEEELEAQKLRFSTYQTRVDVKKGEDAATERVALVDSLLNQGFPQAEIDALLS
jgi:hypothetical protein